MDDYIFVCVSADNLDSSISEFVVEMWMDYRNADTYEDRPEEHAFDFSTEYPLELNPFHYSFPHP